uniref:separase n=1 Tax=Glossina brevipalpis TaxID=37001 RepID=A0A1A9VZZ7_9MUSC
MSQKLLDYVNKDAVLTNIGPNAREILMQQAEKEFNSENLDHSIFYQIRSLYQSSQERYRPRPFEKNDSNSKTMNPDEFLAQMNADEKSDLPDNALIQYALKTFKRRVTAEANSTDDYDIFKDISDPTEGIQRIQDICKQLPEEWTVLQLCKGSNTATTYSKYPEIHKSYAAIYVTILRHVRSCDYPKPICLRFNGSDPKKLYEKFAYIAVQFKKCIQIDPKEWTTIESRQRYWKLLNELNTFIAVAVTELKDFLFPWNFLFSGISHDVFISCNNLHDLLQNIDTFCHQYKWSDQSRVLLSLAASNAYSLTDLEIEKICTFLIDKSKQRAMACDLLRQIRKQQQQQQQNSIDLTKNGYEKMFKCFPVILIVDERLDHFYWEEINVFQEFTRISSLQSLWHLYYYYRKNIQQGYLKVNIKDGACLVNPENNLPKMELRMSTFFEYWLPNWRKILGREPTQEEFFEDLLSRNCYVYSGHGSGLQYVNGRKITKHQLNSVVFLFGCDSSRLNTSGLYSELIGAHLYYHAAMCPAIVGTIMSGLDSNVDRVATEILSGWIAPNSADVLPWTEIEIISWMKKGIIEPAAHTPKCSKNIQTQSVGTSTRYNMGSLCAILARVHQRVGESKLYNTVSYVCRGLPVWNCDVEPLPLN